jgi:hypothetical protein
LSVAFAEVGAVSEIFDGEFPFSCFVGVLALPSFAGADIVVINDTDSLLDSGRIELFELSFSFLFSSEDA